MCKWYNEMTCYILAGGEKNPQVDFKPAGELTRLEKTYRNYAKVFDRVKLVIKADQAKERYLNYPHVCDQAEEKGSWVGISTALADAKTEAVFIGSSAITDFPPQLMVELVKNYNGEAFVGYADENNNTQPLFGIYNKKLCDRLNLDEFENLEDLLDPDDMKLLMLPDEIAFDLLDLN